MYISTEILNRKRDRISHKLFPYSEPQHTINGEQWVYRESTDRYYVLTDNGTKAWRVHRR